MLNATGNRIDPGTPPPPRSPPGLRLIRAGSSPPMKFRDQEVAPVVPRYSATPLLDRTGCHTLVAALPATTRYNMPTYHYSAAKSRSSGRPGWSISFRHPLRTDQDGRPGLKVRRGLGTADDADADRLVEEMNELLSDESYWSIAARPRAELKFSETVVTAFYSGLDAPASTAWEHRAESIPLPGRDEGYARALLVGTTGAGKTTLLRHLIGSDPRTDRFPSTSPGRTTTSDIEVVTADDGGFQAVVTFLSDRAVRSRVQECVAEAILAARRGGSPEDIARRLLQHPDQTFRLSYTLGPWTTEEQEDEGGWGFDEEATAPDQVEGNVLMEAERQRNQSELERFVKNISRIADDVGGGMAADLEIDWDSLKGADLDAAESMLIEEAESREDYDELVESILSAVLRRFERVDGGNLTKSTTGWPVKWDYSSGDRDEFLAQVRWFSSNYAPRFGSLLTPLVQGIRVRGPFFPEFATGTQPKLVLIDGQGLGHTADTVASVTTHITDRFSEVDALLLVDSAQQPMQAAPLAAVRAVAVGGHQEKLLIAFTHFDLVKGPNLRSARDKKEHVLAAVRTGLVKLRSEIGESAVRTIEQELKERCFTLGWIDQPTEKVTKGAPKVVAEMRRLVKAIERSITPTEPIPVTPIYDPASLLFAVQAATRDFQARWSARLGFSALDGERKVHWARVKALNRRIAEGTDIEYDTLKPVADLFARLTEEISAFVERPIEWKGDGAGDPDHRARALNSVRRAVEAVVGDLSKQRVVADHLPEWITAYAHRGGGSTFVRAQEIRDIYEEAAPVPAVVLEGPAKEFLDTMRHVVHDAIEAGGGEMLYGQGRS